MPDAGAGSFVLHAPAAWPGSNRPRQAGGGAGAGCGTDPAHLGHHLAAQDRAAVAAQCVRVGAQHQRQLRLTPQDRELHVMPLFHIHGLIAGVLAPLAAGSLVFCTPGFNALKFFAWMKECRPTWYTAVPTMHQTILARAAGNRDVIEAHPLRFIRSSSSSMPPQVIAELEAVFNAPLIESYGMTEAAHQMASSPLPPARRIPGSVGIAAGPKVAIMDTKGNCWPAGQVGEVVIRGDNVTTGYENNPGANAEALSTAGSAPATRACWTPTAT
jgi:acyl-CoA synthetase (AMP-forming)/AMP-acid ligase II